MSGCSRSEEEEEVKKKKNMKIVDESERGKG